MVSQRGIALLCGHDLGRFEGGEHTAAFKEICDIHGDVSPSDRLLAMSPPETLRTLAELEQRASSLEAEVERRMQTEAQTERLFRLSAAVNRALTLEQVYEPALDAVCAVLRVERAAILLRDDGVLRFRAWRGLSEVYRRTVEGHCPWAADDPDPQPIFIGDVEADESLVAFRALFRSERIGSLGFIPLVHHGSLLGKFMVYDEGPRELSDRERRQAVTIASQVTQAVVRAQLLLSERRARSEAERLAMQADRLHRITAALSTASTAREVADLVVVQGAAAVGAQGGGLWLVSENEPLLRLASSVEYSEKGSEQYANLPLDGSVRAPVVDAVLTGQPVWLPSRHELENGYPQVAAALSHEEFSVACLPMMVEGRCVGALVFSWHQPHDFTDEEGHFLLVLARHCAQGIDRARLYDLEKSARMQAEAAHHRSAFLLEASVILSSSLDFQDTLGRFAQLAVGRMADWCAIEVATAPGHPSQQLVVAHAHPGRVTLVREARSSSLPPARAARGPLHVMQTGVPECYPEVGGNLLATLAPDDSHLAVLRGLRVRSAVIAPMAARGRTLGAITLAAGESRRRYGAADLEIAELLGRRAGIAIDNALLYEAANTAVRAREDILGVVSHDLRNPLGVILLNAASMLRPDGPHSGDHEQAMAVIRKKAGAIQRSAERMSRLIGDLVDFASIEGGRFAISRVRVSPVAVIDAALEMFRALAHDHELRLETRVVEALPEVECDQDRLVQALGNLLSNAVKVTAARGHVTVGARRDGEQVVWFVEDTGPGLSQEELPRLFERYWRGPNARYRGTGLGLSIARGIVEAHGGHIWAESKLGEGSRFSFAIPVSAPVEPDSPV